MANFDAPFADAPEQDVCVCKGLHEACKIMHGDTQSRGLLAEKVTAVLESCYIFIPFPPGIYGLHEYSAYKHFRLA